MVSFVFNLIGSAAGWAAYGLVFGVLLLCGLGFPMPEDVALMTGGYLASKGQASLAVMIAVGFFGIMLGDSAIFFLGRLGRRAEGKLMMTRMLSRHLTPERIAKVEEQFERRGSVMVMIARFLPGIRAATYFVAGGARMSYWRFVFFDGIAALASAPLFVVLGYHLGGRIVAVAHQFHAWLIGGMAVVAAVLVVRWLVKRQRRGATEPSVETVSPSHSAGSLEEARARKSEGVRLSSPVAIRGPADGP